MEGIIDKENERVCGFFALLDDMEKKVERLARDNRPPFNLSLIHISVISGSSILLIE